MNIKYFEDTDTLYLSFSQNESSETRDLDENTVIDYDANGRVVAITIEHANELANVTDFSFQRILAKTA